MQIAVSNPIFETAIFAVIFCLLLLFSIRRRADHSFFPKSATEEIKGFAILMVLFGHIGYFLAKDTRFLYPFSVASGVGVDLFLFISGFGLTVSLLRRAQSPISFYKRRLFKVLLPLWVCLAIFYLSDWLILGNTYELASICKSFLAYFPRADLFIDINSPLWYITPLVFYYLLFPLVFIRRRPAISAIILYIIGRVMLKYVLPNDLEVLNLYQLHYLAFPIGVFFADLVQFRFPFRSIVEWLRRSGRLATFFRWIVLGALLGVFGYYSLHSGVGKSKMTEQLISVGLALVAVMFVLIKKLEIRLVGLFGIFSYEIYLYHWPLMYRFDIFYRLFPPWCATLLYFALFILIGFGFQKLFGLIFKKKTAGEGVV